VENLCSYAHWRSFVFHALCNMDPRNASNAGRYYTLLAYRPGIFIRKRVSTVCCCDPVYWARRCFQPGTVWCDCCSSILRNFHQSRACNGANLDVLSRSDKLEVAFQHLSRLLPVDFVSLLHPSNKSASDPDGTNSHVHRPIDHMSGDICRSNGQTNGSCS
jgi:hypothetical protein